MIDIPAAYFNWLATWVMRDPEQMRYTKLIELLHRMEFRVHPMIPNDDNRRIDGHDLRYRFWDTAHLGDFNLVDQYLNIPVSILETLVALSIRADEGTTYVDHDRSYLWFWDMIKNIGIIQYDDNNFNEFAVISALNRFMDRDYSPDGAGGLFYIPKCSFDLRAYELWYQMQWYSRIIIFQEGK